MCTININTLEMDRQVFWQINYLSKINLTNKNDMTEDSHPNPKVPNLKLFKSNY